MAPSDEEKSARKQRDEPLRTGHSNHYDLVERCRINRAAHLFGHPIPVLVQALIYLALLAALALLLFALRS